MKEIVEAADGKRYKVENGTYYHPDTPDDVIAWIGRNRISRRGTLAGASAL